MNGINKTRGFNIGPYCMIGLYKLEVVHIMRGGPDELGVYDGKM